MGQTDGRIAVSLNVPLRRSIIMMFCYDGVSVYRRRFIPLEFWFAGRFVLDSFDPNSLSRIVLYTDIDAQV